jgi:hypothetical protein
MHWMTQQSNRLHQSVLKELVEDDEINLFYSLCPRLVINLGALFYEVSLSQ